MKKSMIALAVMAAAGAASAQSSVQMYGIADAWFGSAKVKASVGGESESLSQTKLDSGGVSDSRWGLKGSEDLGGGLKANFQLEQGFALDTGKADSGFNREATVGVSGGFGAVTLGKTATAYDDIRGTANNTFDANVSATKSTWVAYAARANNTIKYVTPAFGGFSGGVSYAFGEDKAANANKKSSETWALNAQYATGPLFVGFAHQTQKLGAGSSFDALPLPGVFVSGLSALNISLADVAAELDLSMSDAVGAKVNYDLLTGSYDFGVAKLVGSFNQAKGTAEGLDGSLKAKEYQIGVEVPLASNMALGLGVAQSRLKADGENIAKTTGYSAALVYNLSKRTTAYVAVNQTKLKDELGYDAELKSTLYAVGVKHAF